MNSTGVGDSKSSGRKQEVRDELLLLNIPIELPNQYGRLSPAIRKSTIGKPAK
jgi:hypothetical protein